MITLFKLLMIRAEGKPGWHAVESDPRTPTTFPHRSVAVEVGQRLINEGKAKVVIVYRGEKPTQLLVYRPQTYVHLERI